jgi:hypothetical protein
VAKEFKWGGVSASWPEYLMEVAGSGVCLDLRPHVRRLADAPAGAACQKEEMGKGSKEILRT